MVVQRVGAHTSMVYGMQYGRRSGENKVGIH